MESGETLDSESLYKIASEASNLQFDQNSGLYFDSNKDMYYDPTSSLPTSTSLSHGVEIIRSKQDLGKWIKENINH